MRHLIFIIAAILLCGCRAKQNVIKEVVQTDIVDTTKIRADTASTEIVLIDTTKSSSQTTWTIRIEFADSSGCIRINKFGGITLKHIKNIEGVAAMSKDVKFGVSDSFSQQSGTTTQANGTSQREGKKKEAKEQPADTVQWYEKPLIYIGSLCCIVILIWLIFLYIQKKS